MKTSCIMTLGLLSLSCGASADELDYFQTLYGEQSVETRTLSIRIIPVDQDVRFSVTLHDKETGLEKIHEFDGSAPDIPVPYQFAYSRDCDTSVIQLTVEYPWRHAWPQRLRMLETYAFRVSDFAFIDMVYAPLTDIALIDSSMEGGLDADRQPPIGVRCLSDPNGPPFEYFQFQAK